MTASDLTPLKQLEAENAQMQRIIALPYTSPHSLQKSCFQMSIDRLIQLSLNVAACGLLTACSSAGSGTTMSSAQDVPSTLRHEVAAQAVRGTIAPNTGSCSQLDQQHALKSAEVNIRFPEDCGVTGEIRVPAVTNLQSPPQTTSLCESAEPIGIHGERRGCTSSEPDTGCQQASANFWYDTLTLHGDKLRHARRLCKCAGSRSHWRYDQTQDRVAQVV